MNIRLPIAASAAFITMALLVSVLDVVFLRLSVGKASYQAARQGRLILLGDIHGCYEELLALYDKLEVRDNDVVVALGDFIAKGPQQLEVLWFLRKQRILAIRGNHEHELLLQKYNPEEMLKIRGKPYASPLLSTLAGEMTEADWAWLRSLPYYLRFPEHNLVAVHAGLVAGVALENQENSTMVNLRDVKPDGRATQDEHSVPWASRWQGPELVVFGHDARRRLQNYTFAKGIDTACVYNGSLSAYVLPEQRLVSVPAKKFWIRTVPFLLDVKVKAHSLTSLKEGEEGDGGEEAETKGYVSSYEEAADLPEELTWTDNWETEMQAYTVTIPAWDRKSIDD
eukprot:g34576.t1